MASATNPSSSFESIFDAALTEYAKRTKIDLAASPFANMLRNCDSPDSIIQLLQQKAQDFKTFRERGSALLKWLRPLVQVIYLLSGALGHSTNMVMMNPASAIFVGIHVLLTAASGVTTSYDSLVEIFGCVGNFLNRVQIYTKLPLTPPMVGVIVNIMVELLSVLSLVTKQIIQGRLKKFMKRLLGPGDREIEQVLQRLDRLTQEEVRMATTQTLELVHGLAENVGVIKDASKTSAHRTRQASGTAVDSETDNMTRDQLQKEIRNWLSPPDPSRNHNAARRNHHSGTAEWFTQGNAFKQWKEAGSLLWILGKPGSGKSILCSAIIKEIKALADTGSVLMAYFYCDFRDSAKQDVRDVLTSLLTQLCARSDTFSQVLFNVYLTQNAGSQQPDDDTLAQCLKDMLQLSQHPPVYLIVDAIDECPNINGIVSARNRVLKLVEELVGLHLPNLRICITSRPEADIRASLNSLASHAIMITLHEESGQKEDIIDYIRSVVQSDLNMRNWRGEDKQLVIDTLSEKAEGMFRWAFCQLEALRRQFPSTIRSALDDLPRSLDETYERVLLEIAAERREYAHRLFQCLAVSVRPLHVEELAEILAIQFDGVFPTYNAHWRPEVPEEAVLSACSSLIAFVNVDGSSVVQFSHFSVKEFLTSERLFHTGGNLSGFHILTQSAHTTFAKACLSILLDNPTEKNGMENSPLAIYAAQYWVDHGKFEKVSLSIMEEMKCLFDEAKPYFSRWISMFDIDFPFRGAMSASQCATPPVRLEAAPLYYAILCGFRDLSEHLIVTFPHFVNARGGYHATPLHAAVTTRNVDITLLLLEHGAEVNTLDDEGWGPLHRASRGHHVDVLELLLEHQADVNILGKDDETPLFLASLEGHIEVAQILLHHGATVEARRKDGWTPLTAASRLGHLDVVQLLIQNGAAVDSQDNNGWTPLHSASRYGHLDVVTKLVASGANVNAQKHDLWTALHLASGAGDFEVVQALLTRGAAVNMKNEEGETPLDLASGGGELEMAKLLIKYGADVNSRDNYDWTPLHTAFWNGRLDVIKLLLASITGTNIANGTLRTTLALISPEGNVDVSHLLEHGADMNSSDDTGWTSLRASRYRHIDAVRLLPDHGTAVNIQQEMNSTSPPSASADGLGQCRIADLLPMPIRSGADVDQAFTDRGTRLCWASGCRQLEIVQLLVKYGLDPKSQGVKGCTPLQVAAPLVEVLKLLLERCADVNTRDHHNTTFFALASKNGKLEVATDRMSGVDFPNDMDMIPVDHTLQKRRSDATHSSFSNTRDKNISNGEDVASLSIASQLENHDSLLSESTDAGEHHPTHSLLGIASREGRLECARSLIKQGADVNVRDKSGWTPLHKASRFGHFLVANLLLEHGADVDAKQRREWTPLHLASYNGHFDIVQLLLKRGGNAQARNEAGRMPSEEALRGGERDIAQLLSEYDALGSRV